MNGPAGDVRLRIGTGHADISGGAIDFEAGGSLLDGVAMCHYTAATQQAQKVSAARSSSLRARQAVWAGTLRFRSGDSSFEGEATGRVAMETAANLDQAPVGASCCNPAPRCLAPRGHLILQSLSAADGSGGSVNVSSGSGDFGAGGDLLLLAGNMSGTAGGNGQFYGGRGLSGGMVDLVSGVGTETAGGDVVLSVSPGSVEAGRGHQHHCDEHQRLLWLVVAFSSTVARADAPAGALGEGGSLSLLAGNASSATGGNLALSSGASSHSSSGDISIITEQSAPADHGRRCREWLDITSNRRCPIR